MATTWLQWIVQPASWWVILQVALGLGFVIFVHELGHFLVAKACGVKCEKFFLGFDVGGLKLASVKWGETEYGIGALPLGGYVKMLGQDDNPAAAATEAERARAALESGDLPPEPVAGPHRAWDPRSYPAQSVPERMAIISAGVIMNVIFAVLMASLAFGLGVRELTCEVSGVRPGGAAWRAGLRTGDQITAIGGQKNPIFSDLQKGVTLGDVTKGVEFTIHRPADGSTRTVLLHPDTDLGVPTVGVTSPFSLTLPADLKEGLPGAAGRAAPALAAGDTIRAVDGVPVRTYAELVAALSDRVDRPVRLTIERMTRKGGAAEPLDVELPAQPQRTTGMAMTALPVRAVQDDSPAARAGIRAGDRIVAVDGDPVGDPLALDDRLRALVGKSVRLDLVRDGGGTEVVEAVPREVDWLEESRWPTSPAAVSTLGVAVGVDALVAAVATDGPAARAGIVPGDRVVRVRFQAPGREADGPDEGLELSERSPSWPYVMAALQQVEDGTTLALEVVGADGSKRDVTLVPVEDPGRQVLDRGLLFEPVYRMVRADSALAALRLGSGRAVDDLSLVYKFLHKLTSNQISPRLLGGPIEIAKQAGRSAEEGFSRFLLFLTMLSANLAVVNFLPIPVLDGGHMVFLAYEWIRGKPPSEGVVGLLSYVGLAVILTLMMFVFGLDLGLIPRR
ncbi:MAG: PDZ domain-containing protein [Planctomycetia bacterium]|nr:PDZ domain-containing protein [Planctomycetia bacterium]